MSNLLMERDQFEIGIAAVADFAADDVNSDVVNMKNYDSVRFITHWGVGTTGVVALTVEACDDVVPTTTAQVPFWYRVKVGTAAPGAPTLAVAATGVSNTAGSNQIIECEVTAAQLAASGYQYVRLHVNETTDAALLGGVLIQLGNPKHTTHASTLT
jgi:hypothetical protein